MIPPMSDAQYMRLALRLARKGFGATSPNPMVGAVLVKGRTIIGRGWHRCAGLPHAEIEALRNAGYGAVKRTVQKGNPITGIAARGLKP